MADEQKGNLKSKFGSSLLAGAQGLSDAPKSPKKAPQVRIARSSYANMLSTRILKNAALAIVVLLVVYLAFAATIMRVLPTTSVGLLPVKNLTFEGGLVPPGEIVAVSMTEAQGEEIQDYLAQSLIPHKNVSVVKVIAGPWGTFEWSPPGIIAVEDQIVENVTMEEPSDEELTSEYLVECVRGACVPGEAYVIPTDHLMGVPLADEE
jgi:hypothetical protein